MRDLGLRATAFIAFALVVGGSVWAAYEFLAVRGGDLDAPTDAYAVAAGRSFTVPFQFANTGAEEEAATVSLADPGALAATAESVEVEAPAFGAAAGFLTIAVPQNAEPGDYRLDLEARAADGTRLGLLPVDVTVVGGAGGLAPGQGAAVWYVGRFDGGPVFDTNVRAVALGPWTKAPDFAAHPEWRPLDVVVGPQANVIPGLAKGMLGMRANESRTVVVAPEDGYGAATREETIPRVVEIARDHVVSLQERSVPRRQFDQLITQSRQGDPAAYGEGDVFEIRDELNAYRARVTHIDDESVRYRFALAVGERYTLYPFWPGSSVVAEVEEATMTFRTTPTTEVGGAVTYYDPWPNATRVVVVNETTVLLRHDLDVGFRYEAVDPQRQAAVDYVVRSLDDEWVVVETPNDHPLAGKTLVFDVRVENIS